jgi:hypothetical protein
MVVAGSYEVTTPGGFRTFQEEFATEGAAACSATLTRPGT